MKAFFIAFVFLLSQPLQAFELKANAPKAVQKQLREIESLVPLKMQKLLPPIIEVDFKAWSEGNELSVDICDFTNLKVDDEEIQQSADDKDHTYGRLPLISQGKRILLNALFIKELQNPPRYINCLHGTTHKLFKATVLHELAHLYDRLKLRKRSLIEEFKSKCEQNVYRSKLSDECKGLYDQYYRRHFISDELKYTYLVNWNGKQRNTRSPNTMDPYEFKNRRENFAVNFEYYILDPTYSCRRPSLAKYFDKHFGRNGFTQCEIDHRIFVGGKNLRLVDLDPQKVFRIDYFVSLPGQTLESGWGHSMLRLVLCAPEHTQVIDGKKIKVPARPLGPDCVKDTNSHVVVSYRAGINDITLNYASAFTGAYPSQLFMMELPKVLAEYNIKELRNAVAIPLKLSQTEKKILIYKILENHWGYRGSYKFISNNCATETYDLLRAGIQDYKLYGDEVLTPMGVVKALHRVGRIDYTKNSLHNLKGDPTLYFPRSMNLLLKAYDYLGLRLNSQKSEEQEEELIRFLRENLDERSAIYNDILDHWQHKIAHGELNQQEYKLLKQQTSAIFRLDTQSVIMHMQEAQKQILEIVLQKMEADDLTVEEEEIIARVKKLLLDQSFIIDANSYGIPLANERMDLVSIGGRSSKMDALQKEVERLVAHYLPQAIEKTKRIEATALRARDLRQQYLLKKNNKPLTTNL